MFIRLHEKDQGRLLSGSYLLSVEISDGNVVSSAA